MCVCALPFLLLSFIKLLLTFEWSFCSRPEGKRAYKHTLNLSLSLFLSLFLFLYSPIFILLLLALPFSVVIYFCSFFSCLFLFFFSDFNPLLLFRSQNQKLMKPIHLFTTDSHGKFTLNEMPCFSVLVTVV